MGNIYMEVLAKLIALHQGKIVTFNEEEMSILHEAEQAANALQQE